MVDDRVRIDLACGIAKRDGFVGVDRAENASADIHADLLADPWTFAEPGTVDEFYCSHFIEHIPLVERDGQDLFLWFFDQVYSLLKPGGTITVIAPYYTSMRAWQDPTHRRPITDAVFLYLNKAWRETSNLGHYPVVCDFDFVFAYGIGNPAWANRHEEARSFGIRHYNNVVDDIHVTLTKRG